jgi:hypothetical protein
MPDGRPRLTVSILTRNSEAVLARRIAEAKSFADEVLVGVDAESVDGTLAVARANADVVYQVRHPGQLAPARMLALELASGDWILSLDDDESMEDTFDAIVPELLADPAVTHYWFRRKWAVAGPSCEHLFAPPWYPDWQLRLFRNDRTLVWKPARPHSGYRAQGPGAFETRADILHYEQVQCDPAERARKLESYRRIIGSAVANDMYHPPDGLPRRPFRPRTRTGDRPGLGRFLEGTREPTGPYWAPWGATFVGIDMPREAAAGVPFLALVTVRNSGDMAWHPVGRRGGGLHLAHHLLSADGRMLAWDGPRYSVPRVVPPGGEAEFTCEVRAPAEPGDYLFEWDMVSEGECWFSEGGSSVARSELRVR